MGRLLWWVPQALMLYFIFFWLNNQSNPHFTFCSTKHSFIMMHIIFSTFNFMFCNFPLRSSSWWLNLFFLFSLLLYFSFLYFFDCTFSHILFLILTDSSFMDRTSFLFRMKILHILCDGSSGWEIWMFAFYSVYLEFFCFKILVFYFSFGYKLWMIMLRQAVLIFDAFLLAGVFIMICLKLCKM